MGAADRQRWVESPILDRGQNLYQEPRIPLEAPPVAYGKIPGGAAKAEKMAAADIGSTLAQQWREAEEWRKRRALHDSRRLVAKPATPWGRRAYNLAQDFSKAQKLLGYELPDYKDIKEETGEVVDLFNKAGVIPPVLAGLAGGYAAYRINRRAIDAGRNARADAINKQLLLSPEGLLGDLSQYGPHAEEAKLVANSQWMKAEDKMRILRLIRERAKSLQYEPIVPIETPSPQVPGGPEPLPTQAPDSSPNQSQVMEDLKEWATADASVKAAEDTGQRPRVSDLVRRRRAEERIKIIINMGAPAETPSAAGSVPAPVAVPQAAPVAQRPSSAEMSDVLLREQIMGGDVDPLTPRPFRVESVLGPERVTPPTPAPETPVPAVPRTPPEPLGAPVSSVEELALSVRDLKALPAINANRVKHGKTPFRNVEALQASRRARQLLANGGFTGEDAAALQLVADGQTLSPEQYRRASALGLRVVAGPEGSGIGTGPSLSPSQGGGPRTDIRSVPGQAGVSGESQAAETLSPGAGNLRLVKKYTPEQIARMHRQRGTMYGGLPPISLKQLITGNVPWEQWLGEANANQLREALNKFQGVLNPASGSPADIVGKVLGGPISRFRRGTGDILKQKLVNAASKAKSGALKGAGALLKVGNIAGDAYLAADAAQQFMDDSSQMGRWGMNQVQDTAYGLNWLADMGLAGSQYVPLYPGQDVVATQLRKNITGPVQEFMSADEKLREASEQKQADIEARWQREAETDPLSYGAYRLGPRYERLRNPSDPNSSVMSYEEWKRGKLALQERAAAAEAAEKKAKEQRTRDEATRRAIQPLPSHLIPPSRRYEAQLEAQRALERAILQKGTQPYKGSSTTRRPTVRELVAAKRMSA
jgi:hypothetical protein